MRGLDAFMLQNGNPRTRSYIICLFFSASFDGTAASCWSISEMGMVGAPDVHWFHRRCPRVRISVREEAGPQVRPLVRKRRLVDENLIAYVVRPTVWARVEAERRLEERGESFGWPFPPGYRKDKLVGSI